MRRDQPGILTRRDMLTRCGMGLGGLALGSLVPSLLGGEGDGPITSPFEAKAKTVIFLFMVGGMSHLETFDYKPELEKYHGKSISESPHADVLKSQYGKNLERGFDLQTLMRLMRPQYAFKKHGQSGIEVSELFPHMATCVDDLAVIRSLWTTDNNHQAQFQFLTGRNIAEGNFPSLGAWVHSGLGTLNENLPQFIVFGNPLGTCCGTSMGHGADYLGPQHAGILLDTTGKEALPFSHPESEITKAEQQESFELMRQLNEETRLRYPNDEATDARIKSYELAFRMQMSIPEVMDLKGESSETLKLYGIDRLGNGPEGHFAKQCLLARRFAEGGTRFIQIHHGANGGAGGWDQHSDLKKVHSKNADQVDQPIAGLLADLKRRGMLDSTLVVFATEFGRTPGYEIDKNNPNATPSGRNHHPFGFSCWMAGGGIKGGIVHGATDELGYHAVENRHYVTDVHATILHQLGLIPQRLDRPGVKRIEKDYGNVIREII